MSPPLVHPGTGPRLPKGTRGPFSGSSLGTVTTCLNFYQRRQQKFCQGQWLWGLLGTEPRTSLQAEGGLGRAAYCPNQAWLSNTVLSVSSDIRQKSHGGRTLTPLTPRLHCADQLCFVKSTGQQVLRGSQCSIYPGSLEAPQAAERVQVRCQTDPASRRGTCVWGPQASKLLPI